MKFFRRKHHERESPTQPATRPAPDREADADRLAARFLADAERAVPGLMADVEVEAERMRPEMEREAARIRVATDAAVREAMLDADTDLDEYNEPESPPVVGRRDYVPKEDEARHLVRDADGLPTLRLVDAGDRLAIWSPLDGGALLNPKGPGLRSLGLSATYARGGKFHATAYRTADLRKGRPVELHREPDNEHDRNAIALHAPGARKPFAYVQKGRAPALAKRIDAGEALTGVCLWGPGKGRDDDTAFLLIGSTDDMRSMLDGY